MIALAAISLLANIILIIMYASERENYRAMYRDELREHNETRQYLGRTGKVVRAKLDYADGVLKKCFEEEDCMLFHEYCIVEGEKLQKLIQAFQKDREKQLDSAVNRLRRAWNQPPVFKDEDNA